MKNYKLGILFTQPPFGTATSREGLDALLAASAFCEEDEILICFINDGVFNLVHNQQSELILQKNHTATFKLIELYELSECFICEDSLKNRDLDPDKLIISELSAIPQSAIFDKLKQAEKVLTF